MGESNLKKILYISFVDWFWIRQRPQHTAQLLSEKNRVDYVCIPRWKKNTNTTISHFEEDKLDKSEFKINNNLTIFRKKLIPKGKIPIIRTFNNFFILKPFINNLQKLNSYDCIICTHPSQIKFIPKNLLATIPIIYDCMDDYLNFIANEGEKNYFINNEQLLVSVADKIIVSSSTLAEIISKKYNVERSLINIINNGVDIDNFNLNIIDVKENYLTNNGKIKVGYIGTISSWLDIELINKVSNYFEEIEFYFIGPTDFNVTERFPNLNKNLIFIGSQPYYKIPQYIYEFDVLIMPFKITDLVKAVNPVKIYEYLAMGKPVIASKYEETQKFGDLIACYENKDEFINMLKEILATPVDFEFVARQIDFSKKNSWRERVKKINDVVEDIVYEDK